MEIIVIGAGHAGCEAALAVARMGVKVKLITSHINKIAMTPCNPAIGGPAKGIVVREIDALGGQMAVNTDKSSIQIKILNESKGEAVHAMRAQVDKILYPQNMRDTILNETNIEVIEEMVNKIIFDENNTCVKGVVLENDETILSDQIILTAGTYMSSYIINGEEKIFKGPENTKTNNTLSASLMNAGIEMFKLKTGTPARVAKESIDYSKTQVAPGSNKKIAFSYYEPKYIEHQVDCHLIYTNAKTHEIIQKNLSNSAMYSGVIEGVGPRYCPSIEDKITRFKDKERHQLFLEPETRDGNSIYIQGFSTSMPYAIQDEMIHSLEGLENAEILHYGYAIEYDAIKSKQLKNTLEFKKIKGLFSAGQVNGTSGYEEAAGQGIVAGINAALSFKKEKPFILSRSNSYIGLMIDDLITKGTEEPYRLLTSRSEYRLILRNDNADMRLSEMGHSIGLLSVDKYEKFLNKKEEIKEIFEFINSNMITPKNLNSEMANLMETEPIDRGYTIAEFLKRPNITFEKLKSIYDFSTYADENLKQVEIEVKYEGYINKINSQIKRFEKLENVKIPDSIDYKSINNLALEAREKLSLVLPQTIGQASRISGINPSDITALEIFLETQRRKSEEN